MVADLRVNLGGLELENPLVIASADIGCYLEQIKEAERYGAGAFITKGCIPSKAAVGFARKPRFRVDLKKGALSGLGGARRLTLEQSKRLISNAKKEVRIPVGANIFLMSASEEEKEAVTNAAKEICECGSDFIELDTTGNLAAHFGETEDKDVFGEYFMDEMAAKYPMFVHDTIKNVKKVVKVPVITKVAFENINVPFLAKAMENAGADIIDIGNMGTGVLPGMMDIYNPGKPWGGFESADKCLGLYVTGDPLRMISQAYLIRCAKFLRTPILGCGGIMSWQNAVEAIMCGATAVASCTLFMIRGFEVLEKMKKGLLQFMDEQGYRSIAEFRGVFLDKVALTHSEIHVHDAIARVDPEKCNGCGLCAKPAHCGRERKAISMVNKKVVVDEPQCTGCETCASICPVHAIQMLIKD